MARGQRRSSLRNERAPQPADRKRSHSLAEAVAQPADATRVDIVHKASPRTRRPISGVPPGHYSSGTVAFQRPMTGVDNATRGNQLQVRLPDARRRSGGPLERAPGRFALGYAFGRPDKVRRCRGFVATCFLSAYRVAVSRSGACARGRLRAVREVCERRGHKDAATTLRIYVRAFDGATLTGPQGPPRSSLRDSDAVR
jgi:hypothetical protein